MSPHFLTIREFLLGLALVSWAFARVGVQHPSLRLPYIGVFYSLFFTSHWISFVHFSRWQYLHPTTNPPTYSRLGTGTVVVGYPKRLRYHGGGVYRNIGNYKLGGKLIIYTFFSSKGLKRRTSDIFSNK